MPLYDERFQQLIANNINASASIAEIVEGLKVSQRTVYEYHYNISSFRVHNPPPANILYCPQIIHLATQEAIVDLLITNLKIYLNKI